MADVKDLSLYEVEINGITHTFQLDAEDAKRYGSAAKKVRGGSVEQAEPTTQPDAKARAGVPNKARGADSAKSKS